MPGAMPTIRVTPAELALTLRIWLTVIGQRRPDILRNLWTRRGEDYDREKIEFARTELARTIVENLERAHWQVMREETMHDRLHGRDEDG